MRTLLTFSCLCMTISLFSQNLEVEGKAKITQMDKVNAADSIVVWLQDSMLGIRDAASLNKQLIDSDADTKILVEENPDDDIILFYSRDSEIMRVDSSGRVGIGTTQPAAILHVDSAVLFTGNFNSMNPGPPPASGRGTRLMWYPGKAAFRAGFVAGERWDSINIGQESFAMGWNTIASGRRSTAMGEGTNASGFASTAMGSGTITSGLFSTAMGEGTNASGDNSTAMGAFTEATGQRSTAMGLNTTASGSNSTAIGFNTIASGSISTVMGFNTQANGYASTVLGMYNDPIVSRQTSPQPATPLFIIGNGDSGVGNESNAMVVRKDGKVGIGTDTPGAVISNALVEVNEGHIALSNNYGVFSNNNTGTGFGAGFDTNTDDDLLLFAGGLSHVTIEENGQVGIGTESPTALLEVNADIVKKVNGGTWTASSDRRLKQDIRDYREGLDKILGLRPVYFHYNKMSGYDSSVEHIGIIAQELQEVAPHMVSSYQKDGDQYLQVDNSAMIYMLVNAVKEQQMMINQLQEEIEKLKKQEESSSLAKSEMN
ncbi:MAG: tail fiber domain-containing protein [Saprospiraceae bacterium]|nr:tail fiber domain-containing protein [Saprospiraceae bacterium]